MPQDIWRFEDYVRFSESHDVQVRSWAFERLRDIHGERAVAPIAKLLHDHDEFIACMAPAFLAEQEAVEYAPIILKRFRETRAEGSVANACALALGKLGYQKAVPALANRLGSCEPLAFMGIVEALGNLGGERARKALVNLAEGAGRNDSAVAAVYEAVMALGDPGLASLLVERYLELPTSGSGESNEVLEAFKSATHSEGAYAAFQEGADGDEVFAQLETEIGLTPKESFTPSYLETLKRLWEEGNYQGVISAVVDEASAVSRTDGERVRTEEPPSDFPDLTVEYERRRSMALGLLKAFGESGESLRGRDEELLRQEAALATACLFRAAAEVDYGEILTGADDRLETLSRILRQGPAGMPSRLIEETAARGSEAVKPLLEIMRGDFPRRAKVRAAWAMSLLARGNPSAAEEAVPVLLDGLNEDNPQSYQDDCAQALCAIGAPAISQVVPLVESGGPHLRRNILEILSYIPVEDSVDAILEHLPALTETNLAETLEALRKLGSGKAIEPLRAQWDGREVDTGEIILFLCRINQVEVPGMDELKQSSANRLRREEEQLEIVRATGRARRALPVDDDPMPVLLRCRRCKRAYEYGIERVYSDDSIADRTLLESREEDFYLQGPISCLHCGEVDDFELPSEGFLALAAEQMRGSELTRGGNRRLVGTSRLKFIPFTIHDGTNLNPGQALEFYDGALEEEPDDDQLHSGYARVLARLERWEEAEGEYRRALELNPESAEAHMGLATALQQRGDDSEAEAMYRRARDLAPPQSTLAGEVERSLEELNPEGSGSGREDGPKPAVGRNDPCPCGSGKKYKHCCMKKKAG
jgi:HEAT repeat protein